MKYVKPKLFSVMKNYTKEQFLKDLVAGIIVAIIALPLSIALALASGVNPAEGIYTAIVAGFVAAFFSGSRVQITGPTAALSTVIAGIVLKEGIGGLMIVTIMAGIILIIMGLCKVGDLIKFIPFTITTSFTFGIGINIAIGQIKDFLGLTFTTTPVENMDKVKEIAKCIGTFNWQALVVGILSLVVLIIWPKISKKIPNYLIAVVVGSLLLKGMDLLNIEGFHVNTIGDLYEISSELPSFRMPEFSFATIQRLLPDAVTMAILAGIVSLLSCVVVDGIIGKKHNPNAELVAQGFGNIFSGFFGGIPATGAVARTVANAKNGGRTPIAAMIHAIVLVLVLVFLMPYAGLIPMPTIAAILFVVAYNMSGWKVFWRIMKTAPKSDITVAVITLVFTVIFKPVIAISSGMVLAMVLFMKRMADVTGVQEWKEASEDEQKLMNMPKGTMVYEFNGPMFFAASNNIMDTLDKTKKVVILRMNNVNAVDITGMNLLRDLQKKCKKKGITLLISRLQEQPTRAMEKAGLIEKIGKENIFPHVEDALVYAKEICTDRK